MKNRAVNIIEIIKNPGEYPVEMVSMAIASISEMIKSIGPAKAGRKDKSFDGQREYNFVIPENYRYYVMLSARYNASIRPDKK